MNRKTFTSEDIRKMSKNKNIIRCGKKSVMYRKNFKLRVLEQYNEEGLSAVEIFESAGFDLDIIGIRRPNKLMHQWNLTLGTGGVKKPAEEIIGEVDGVQKKKRSSLNLRTLKAKVAYLEGENDFLEKLRARRKG